MIQVNHRRFSCNPDMSLTIFLTIFSGALMTTDTPSGPGVYEKVCPREIVINDVSNRPGIYMV